ncbi:D-aminoacylase [Alteromonas sediminis]|uniref:D-aminoacylase n=1 Tax=Alteromonas sediminis TaxID=2259342 RepID=A0A3N5Y3T2_9ALTE|nr:D-aminoacylase [Alteromonas sediminis]RPJ68020.1 D-aminoacylase [Alteromonas sediminis]
MEYDLLIKDAIVVDGTGREQFRADVAVTDGKIEKVGQLNKAKAKSVIDAFGQCLAPGFIDVHSHDDTSAIRKPKMEEKVTQGVTTVVVGNCGISASPITLCQDPPDPMNLLGDKEAFCYPTFSCYADAVAKAMPNVNIAALIGHTTLRAHVMDDLSREATEEEITKMRELLDCSLAQGAIGLSSGLAYATATHAPPEELVSLMPTVAKYNGLYVTHLRNEFEAIVEALNEAFETAGSAKVPLVVSHVKCAGKANWGRSAEVIDVLDSAAKQQTVASDCYPYSASASTLDLNQVTDEIDIFIPWSKRHPEMAGRLLADIAQEWQISLIEAAQKLQPAGAVYHCMDESDVEAFLKFRLTMIGSDGLPGTPSPHPRLWGTFPKVIGHYCRERKLFDLPTAIHKMTGLSAAQFGLHNRGVIAEGHWADLVLFDFSSIADMATYDQPQRPSKGISHVWVNGKLSYQKGVVEASNGGMLIKRVSVS